MMTDGIGFKYKPEKTGIGITSIKDRISRLKGQININSEKETTTVSIQIPIFLNSVSVIATLSLVYLFY